MSGGGLPAKLQPAAASAARCAKAHAWHAGPLAFSPRQAFALSWLHVPCCSCTLVVRVLLSPFVALHVTRSEGGVDSNLSYTEMCTKVDVCRTHAFTLH